MRKVLVTGAAGQLGQDVCAELRRRGVPFLGAGRADCDITDAASIRACFAREEPDAVIHCAAYTKVDQAEDEPELCYRINADGTRQVAEACRSLGAKLVYLSTDYVFPGEGERPYETDDATGPRNVYGASKLAGEASVRELLERYFIVRISWVFGVHGKNFVKTMLRLAETHDEIGVVADQFGSPTYTADLAPLLCDMHETEHYGVYHGTNEGVCSWAQFAEEIFRQAGRQVCVRPLATEAYPAKAARPRNSRLSKDSLDRAGFARLPRWEDALERYLREQEEIL